MNDSPFISHTPENAPEGARQYLSGAQRQFGFIPEPMARMAAAPELLEAFFAANGVFEKSTAFTPIEREVIIMTIGTNVGCHYCVAMHTSILERMGAPQALVDALREQRPLSDERSNALATFTKRVLDTHGRVDEKGIHEFLEAGFTTRHALDVVLAVGTYTLTTFANRLTDAPLDAAFAAFRWERSAAE